ncbi:MAG TPA: hypothetical protein VJC12_02790 [Candidatus Paceibacterota bacterium]
MKETAPELNNERADQDPREVLREEFRTGLQSAIDELFQTTDQLDGKRSGAKELRPKTRNKFESLSRKATIFCRRLSYILIFALTSATAKNVNEIIEMESERSQIQQVKDTVFKKQTINGVEFNHTDPTTTHIINYLAGRDTLSEDEVEEIFKMEWKKVIKDKIVQENLKKIGVRVPKNINELSIDETASLLSQAFYPGYKDLLKAEALKRFRSFPRSFPYNEGVYEALWTIESETGKPKIRFTQTIPLNRTASYDRETNTIGMWVDVEQSPDDMRRLSIRFEEDSSGYPLFSEMSHSTQWSKDSKGATEKLDSDWKDMLDISKEMKIPFDSAQKFLYNTPGSIEHEAHQIIEPAIKARFRALIKEMGVGAKSKTNP